MNGKRRFYRAAAAEATGDGWCLLLDGRPVRTPKGARLAVSSETVARALAAEWERQGALIEPRSMPLTRLVGSALDDAGPDRRRFVDRVAAYAETDLLCYRAEMPPDLVHRQREGWDPLLEWAAERYGARLRVRTGLMPYSQDPDALALLRGQVERFDAVGLSAMNVAVPALGSLVLALAIVEGRLGGEEAFELSQLDESFQMERWGEDDEALARRARLHDEVLAAELILATA